jgi:hypothetical protein
MESGSRLTYTLVYRVLALGGMHRVDISPGTIMEFSVLSGTTPQASAEVLLDTPA